MKFIVMVIAGVLIYPRLLSKISTKIRYYTCLHKNGSRKPTALNLASIVSDHVVKYSFQMPPDDAVVVHIRSGDDYKGRGIGNNKNYVALTKEIHTYLESGAKKIIIVTAMHYGISNKSEYYKGKHNCHTVESVEKNIEILSKFCDQFDVPIEIMSNKNIDYDFCFLSYASCLVTSNGQFSKLAKEVNTLLSKDEKPKCVSTLTMPDTHLDLVRK